MVIHFLHTGVVPYPSGTSSTETKSGHRAGREGISVEEVEKKSKATIPVGRYGRPDEYGDFVAFLASERASYITGSMHRIDGGATLNI